MAYYLGMEGCLGCDLTEGRVDLPGGRIFATEHWVVEHCIGPLGAGTLIVKPLRHCVHVWELSDGEVAEMGPLLRRAASVINELLSPDQVFVCLWSFMGWQPGHLHYVVQPAWAALQQVYAKPGPFLQADMFSRNEAVPREDVEAFSDRARAAFAAD